jgi:EAL domain-containing protein (putative c-di-GMP-specific phosphodiesterase class I)
MLGDFAARCDRILKSERLAPDRLILEITESIFIGEPLLVMEALEALRGLGIEIAIDDFGTGYSSLSYLKRFPIDKIKIDQSFVRDIADEAASLGIVQAVTMLAQTLGVSVIAEGVEHEQQVDFLRLLGCNEGQGFLFGRPVAANKIRHMLSRPGLDGARSSQSAA